MILQVRSLTDHLQAPNTMLAVDYFCAGMGHMDLGACAGLTAGARPLPVPSYNEPAARVTPKPRWWGVLESALVTVQTVGQSVIV